MVKREMARLRSKVREKEETIREQEETIRALREQLKMYQATPTEEANNNIRDEIFDENENMI